LVGLARHGMFLSRLPALWMRADIDIGWRTLSQRPNQRADRTHERATGLGKHSLNRRPTRASLAARNRPPGWLARRQRPRAGYLGDCKISGSWLRWARRFLGRKTSPLANETSYRAGESAPANMILSLSSNKIATRSRTARPHFKKIPRKSVFAPNATPGASTPA
jgi:hypothetical protein